MAWVGLARVGAGYRSRCDCRRRDRRLAALVRLQQLLRRLCLCARLQLQLSPYGTGASGYNSYNYNYPSAYNNSAYNSFAYVPGYTYGYRVAEDAVAYCKQRFRSYNAATGTYLGYDGQRHSCP